MRRDKQNSDAGPKVKVSLKILPFGSISYEITSSQSPAEEKESEGPRYVQPLTTNVERVEIHYEGGETYLVPKTTAGI